MAKAFSFNAQSQNNLSVSGVKNSSEIPSCVRVCYTCMCVVLKLNVCKHGRHVQVGFGNLSLTNYLMIFPVPFARRFANQKLQRHLV